MNSTQPTPDEPRFGTPVDDATASLKTMWHAIEYSPAPLHPAAIYELIGALRDMEQQTVQVMRQLIRQGKMLAERDDLVFPSGRTNGFPTHAMLAERDDMADTNGGDAAAAMATFTTHMGIALSNFAAASYYLGLAHSAITWVNIVPEDTPGSGDE